MNAQSRDYPVVKLTYEDGHLLARILKRDEVPSVDDAVYREVINLAGDIFYELRFCDMPPETAQRLAANKLAVLTSVAEATVNIAQETEQWYMLHVTLRGQALLKPQRFTKALARAISAVGWLNPIVLGGQNNAFAFDCALSDEAEGRGVIDRVMKAWGIAEWSLEVKPDGIRPT